jgi:hypothetical protein
LAESKKQLTVAMSQFPLDATHIISVKGDISELESGVKELGILQKELF